MAGAGAMSLKVLPIYAQDFAPAPGIVDHTLPIQGILWKKGSRKEKNWGADMRK
jgi:hypothetical protein